MRCKNSDDELCTLRRERRLGDTPSTWSNLGQGNAADEAKGDEENHHHLGIPTKKLGVLLEAEHTAPFLE